MERIAEETIKEDLQPAASDEIWSRCWTKWASKPDFDEDIRQHLQERKILYEFFRKALDHLTGKKLKVLEVGCGSAIDSHLLAEDERLEIYGVDRSEKSLEVAQRVSGYFSRAPTFLIGDAAHLSFSEETFDIVFSQGLIEHFRDPLAPLREQVRVLKSSGCLIVDVPQKYAGLGLYSLRKHWKIKRGTWEWGWETEYSYLELKKLGRSLGLTPVCVGGYAYDGFFNLLANPHIMIEKKTYLRRWRAAQSFKKFYLDYLKSGNDKVWNWLSRRYGHWFLICIVVMFKKEAP
jgi:ubiquinone/menaquinone biosynthesis C-methylase UbiE